MTLPVFFPTIRICLKFITMIKVILTMIRVCLHFYPLPYFNLMLTVEHFAKKNFELRINGFSTDSSMVSLKCNHFIDIRERKNQMPYFWIPKLCSGPNKKPVLLSVLWCFFAEAFFFCSVREGKLTPENHQKTLQLSFLSGLIETLFFILF